jgi:hypothetical protein
MMDLFTRHGTTPFTGTPHHDAKGRPFTVRTIVCDRCGGQGGADQWKFTGWTCFKCAGKRTLGTESVALYTSEQLAKLNATAAKRAAKKAAKIEAAAAQARAEADARRTTFLAQHGALLESAKPFVERSSFVADVVRKAEERAALSDKQAEALQNAVARLVAQAATRAGSHFVGAVGERIEIKVTAERVVSIETQFGILRIATMRDAAGNAIVSKGKFVPPTAQWTEEQGWKVGAEPFAIRATVKEHATYRDEQQTIVQRATLSTPATE